MGHYYYLGRPRMFSYNATEEIIIWFSRFCSWNISTISQISSWKGEKLTRKARPMTHPVCRRLESSNPLLINIYIKYIYGFPWHLCSRRDFLSIQVHHWLSISSIRLGQHNSIHLNGWQKSRFCILPTFRAILLIVSRYG